MPLTTLFFPRIAKLAPKLALISVFKKHITETKLEGKALNEEVIKLEAPAKTLQGSEDSESEKKKPNVLNCNIKPVEDSLRSAIEIDSQFRPISGERSSSLDYIKTYVEFSFSDLNLAKMNKSSFYSYIPLKEVLELDFIKKLNVDQEILVEVIKGSSHLQLDEEKKMVRRLDPITVINDDTAPLIDWFNYFKAVTRLSDLSTALLQYFQLDNLPPLFCLNPAIIRCGELGSPELVKKIFEGLKLRGKKPLTSHMFSYCVALVQYGDMKGALAILNDAIDQGVKPDSSLWTQFFNAVCRNGRVQDALLLFDFMKKSGVKPSVVTYTLLMEACGVHDKEKLLLLLNEMQSLGIADTLHYTCYLKVLKEEGNLKEAVDLVQTMKQRGVKLSLRTYEIYLATVARSGDIKFALNILAEIDALTDKRSPAVYRALLYCCYVAEDLEEAKRISLELLRDGYKLDRTNYHSLLAVGRKQSFQYTQKVFEMMKADGLLDTLSCNLLIFSAARIKRFDAAWECYEQMLKDGSTKPDHVTLSGLLYAKGMAFGLEKAFEFLNTLKQDHGFRPDLFVVNMLLNVCSIRSELEKTLLFFKEQFEFSENSLLPTDVRPDRVTYGTLLNACAKFAAVGQMFELYENMKSSGLEPDAIILSIMLSGCSSAGDANRVSYLIEELKRYGFSTKEIAFSRRPVKKNRGLSIEESLFSIDSALAPPALDRLKESVLEEGQGVTSTLTTKSPEGI